MVFEVISSDEAARQRTARATKRYREGVDCRQAVNVLLPLDGFLGKASHARKRLLTDGGAHAVGDERVNPTHRWRDVERRVRELLRVLKDRGLGDVLSSQLGKCDLFPGEPGVLLEGDEVHRLRHHPDLLSRVSSTSNDGIQ